MATNSSILAWEINNNMGYALRAVVGPQGVIKVRAQAQATTSTSAGRLETKLPLPSKQSLSRLLALGLPAMGPP